ncbi:MAG TPA: pilin [Patescibacteria group bacterium]|nr:pilin [Patescibacteria group bacterium]
MTKTIKTILLLVIIIFSFQVFIPTTLAQNESPESLEFTPQVPIPGSEFDGGTTTVGTSKVSENEAGREVTTMYSTLLPRYIKAIYNYGIGIAAFLALMMIVAGGIIWLTSAGASEKIGTAKSMITSSIIGLVLLLGTYTLLQIVSPALLSFKPIETEYIGVLQFGCCEINDNEAKNTTNKDCDKIDNAEFKTGYSATSDGTQCLKDGCCIIITEEPRSYGTITTYVESTNCIDANIANCSKTYNETIYAINSDFQDMECSQVADYNCETINCEGADDGDKCSSSLGDCRCYDETPYYGEGNEGEPCGNDGGICFSDPPQVVNGSCNGDWDTDWRVFSGRKCKDGLECCYYNP